MSTGNSEHLSPAEGRPQIRAACMGDFAVHTTYCLNISPCVDFHCREQQINAIKSLNYSNKYAYHRENKLRTLMNINTKSTTFRTHANTISSNLPEEFMKRHRPQWMLDSRGFWECLLLFIPVKSFQFLDKHGANLRTSIQVVWTLCCCFVCWAHSHLWKGDVYLFLENIGTSSEALGQPQYSYNLWLTACAEIMTLNRQDEGYYWRQTSPF